MKRCAHCPTLPIHCPAQPQLCPLKSAQDLSQFWHLSEPEAIRAAAAKPRTLFTAVTLLVKPDAAAAAALEQRFCNIFLDPAIACGWSNASVKAVNATYRAHLTARGAASEGLVGQLAKLQPPKQLGWFSWKDPLEGPSEGVVQSAMWW